MVEHPLPRWVTQTLAARGWKSRGGAVVERNTFVRDGVMITVNVGRSRQSFVVSYRKLSAVWNRLLDTDQLHQLIDKGEMK